MLHRLYVGLYSLPLIHTQKLLLMFEIKLRLFHLMPLNAFSFNRRSKNLYSSVHQDTIDTILLTVTLKTRGRDVTVNKIVSIMSWGVLEYRFF